MSGPRQVGLRSGASVQQALADGQIVVAGRAVVVVAGIVSVAWTCCH